MKSAAGTKFSTPFVRIHQTFDAPRDLVFDAASLGTVEFEAVGAGTRLIYTEQVAFFDGADGPSSREQGWRGLLESLAATLARKAPGN